MINVTKPFLPPQKEYNKMVEGIWNRVWLTNDGPLVQELEEKLQQYLDVPSMHFVTNGTMALQLAIKALDLTGEIITTPFSFVATSTTILWESCTPVYVDIDPNTLTIDSKKIEEAITSKTCAIMATHVYGTPCDVEGIEKIAEKYNLKVIYDGAHAFGVKYKGTSIFNYGDISMYSFHATKVFHTVEGGGVTCNSEELVRKIELLRSYGYVNDQFYLAGINAKGTEFHAAMGLCNIKYIESNLQKRKALSELYNSLLATNIQVIKEREHFELNYAYYPIILRDEEELEKVMKRLADHQIHTRRYFYPSLNNLPYLQQKYKCPVSEDISSRILCIPLYAELEHHQAEKIAKLVDAAIMEE